MNNKSLVVFKKRSAIFVSLILLSTSLLTGCGSSSTSSTSDDTDTTTSVDTTPDAFTFVDQTSVALNTLTESAAITVSGIDTASDISVSGGEYSIDSGAYTSTAGTVSNGQTVMVRHTSSDTNYTNVDTTLTIGGVSDIFSTTTVVISGLYDVVDTDQTTCYDSSTGALTDCANTGYDADYTRNPPSYTLTDGGLTVTDNQTGLIWLQTTDIDGVAGINVDDKLSQSSAASYCSTLDLGLGYTWRLPSIKELYSLILFSGKDPSGYTGTDTNELTPFIDNTIFDIGFGDLDGGERIIDGQYVSSTFYVSTTMAGDETVFGVNFVDGRIKGYPTAFGDADKMFYVRCVTGNTSYGVNKFTDNDDQTITDAATGLMWQKNDSISTDWDDAVLTCESATTAGRSMWRLPNTKELQSIVDYTRSPDADGSAAIDPIFTSTSFNNEEDAIDWGYYWAATTHVNYTGDGSSAAYLSFGRALGYYDTDPTEGESLVMYDVHGAGAQRSNDKLDVATTPGVSSADLGYGTFYYHGPQGDVLRHKNRVRCVNSDYLD